MPKILTTTTGIFPKIGGNAPNLRASLHKLDRGEISAEDLEKILAANIQRAVTEQLDAGIDLPTDGLIRSTDLFSPFVQSWGGITRRGIHRFYDTNTLYGEPVVEGELTYAPSKYLEDYKFARTIHPEIKATLPGVFTFAAACVDNFYHEPKKLRAVIAENLLSEAKALIQAGAKYIELHEPELGWNKYDAEEIKNLYAEFAKLSSTSSEQDSATLIVTSYFRNFDGETLSALLETNVSIGFQKNRPHECEWDKSGKTIQVGLVDSRETRLEPEELFEKFREKITTGKLSAAKEILVSTSSHVEYLPHTKAIAKIGLLKKVKQE